MSFGYRIVNNGWWDEREKENEEGKWREGWTTMYNEEQEKKRCSRWDMETYKGLIVIHTWPKGWSLSGMSRKLCHQPLRRRCPQSVFSVIHQNESPYKVTSEFSLPRLPILGPSTLKCLYHLVACCQILFLCCCYSFECMHSMFVFFFVFVGLIRRPHRQLLVIWLCSSDSMYSQTVHAHYAFAFTFLYWL